MAKNKIQHQKGYSLFEFMKDYGTENQCKQALFNWRWPNGFQCPMCQEGAHCQLRTRPIYQCSRCHHQTSLTGNTLFSNTKLPLTKWFLAMFLLTQSKSGLSAMELKRQLGVNYDTAWKMKHKLLQAMKENNDQIPLDGIIQIDDVYWGGEQRGGKRGRGSSNKTPFVAAVSLNKDGHPIHMRRSVIKGFKSIEIEQWAKKHLKAASIVISDGLACFTAVGKTGCLHFPVVMGARLELLDHKAFKWVNVMIGNVKNALRGSCHTVSVSHLPRYLAEFCFCFNHRFDLPRMLPKLGKIAMFTPPMPYRLLKLAEPSG